MTVFAWLGSERHFGKNGDHFLPLVNIGLNLDIDMSLQCTSANKTSSLSFLLFMWA